MDSKIIQIFLSWLTEVCKIDKNMIVFNIFLHKTHKSRINEVRKYWSEITGFSVDSFSTIYWKESKLNTNRKNIREKYYGVLKIKVKRSSGLVRKIAGWSQGVFEKIIDK